MKNKLLWILLAVVSAIGVIVTLTIVFFNIAVDNAKLPIYGRLGAIEGEVIYVYSEPSISSRIVRELEPCYHGLCDEEIISMQGNWYEVAGGYVLGAQVDAQTWYAGTGEYVIVATNPKTFIYADGYNPDTDEEEIYETDEYVMPGTIIGDLGPNGGIENRYIQDEYYMLMTAHDYLYVHKDDVTVLTRKEFEKLILRNLF